jgi:tRNA (guanine6-N2)-methyltransferase
VTEYEIEVIPGLEDSVEDELRTRPYRKAQIIGRPREGRVAVRFEGAPARLNLLKSAVAVHQILTFSVPRPRGLLGHEHLTRLSDALQQVIGLYPKGTFISFHLSAAGAESTVYRRLGQEIASRLSLEFSQGPAQLQMAIYPTSDRQEWHVSIRLSPVPLSTRSWRRCNLPGALNATIAHAMVRLAAPGPDDRFLNVCCGSGTLLVERLDLMPTKLAIGIDLSSDALECAEVNVQASGHTPKVLLARADATQLQFHSGSIDTVVTDLPYGQLVGSDANLETLYVGVIAEATRVIAPGGHLVAITTRNKLFDVALEPVGQYWRMERQLSLKVPFRNGYIQPAVYSLRKVL